MKALLFLLGSLFFVSSLLPMTVRAYDPYGHMLVCRVAYERLNPNAKAAVDELCGQIPYPGTTYTPVTMGCWMDDIREKDASNPFSGKFKVWHYITWGLEEKDASPLLDPVTGGDDEKEGNVIQGLKRSLSVLQGKPDEGIPNRAVALAILSHLTGDVHQPLHCASHFYVEDGKSRNDAGGNRVVISNSPEFLLPGGKKGKSNLHAFWDEGYRAEFDADKSMIVVDEQLKDYTKKDMEALDKMMAALSGFAPEATVSLETNFEAWGKESNGIARDFAYGKLPGFKDNREAGLTADYVAKTNEISKKRVVLAGYRLAAVLNEALGKEEKK